MYKTHTRYEIIKSTDSNYTCDPIIIMKHDSLSEVEIRSILNLKRIAVVGMSRDPSKDAHQVPKYLIKNGYDVIPVNPYTDEILGRRCYSKVSEIESPVDIVEIFRPSDQVLSIMYDVIKKQPCVVWLQLGIHNIAAEQLATKSGIKVVFNRCMLIEHTRLI